MSGLSLGQCDACSCFSRDHSRSSGGGIRFDECALVLSDGENWLRFEPCVKPKQQPAWHSHSRADFQPGASWSTTTASKSAEDGIKKLEPRESGKWCRRREFAGHGWYFDTRR